MFSFVKLLVFLSPCMVLLAEMDFNEEEICLVITKPSHFVGSSGPPGPKGGQGEPGTCKCSAEDIRNSLIRPGWFSPGNFFQYFVTSTRQSWEAGREICRSLGGDLAAVGIRNFTILKNLTDKLTKNQTTWIGLHDIPLEGSFTWVDGITSTLNNTKWNKGEPNNVKHNEDCVELVYKGHRGYKLNDQACSDSSPALCETRLM